MFELTSFQYFTRTNWCAGVCRPSSSITSVLVFAPRILLYLSLACQALSDNGHVAKLQQTLFPTSSTFSLIIQAVHVLKLIIHYYTDVYIFVVKYVDAT